MTTETVSRSERIARLNDRARSGFDPSARIMFTRGCLDCFCSGDTPSGLLAQAAKLAGRNRTDFYKLLARHGLQSEEFKLR